MTEKLHQIMNFSDYLENTLPKKHVVLEYNSIFTRHLLLKHKEKELQAIINDFSTEKYIDVLEYVYESSKLLKKRNYKCTQKDITKLVTYYLKHYELYIAPGDDREFYTFCYKQLPYMLMSDQDED